MGWRAERRQRMWVPAVVVLLAAIVVGCQAAAPVTLTPVPTVSPQATPSAQRTATSAPVTRAAPPTFTATTRPIAKPTPTFTPSPTSTEGPEEVKTVRFTIVYDNNAYPGSTTLRTSWGFACWVETEEMTVLFDTGGDGATLMHNLGELELDPLAIDAVVLSHAHGDHTGGLGALLGTGTKPTVYVPASFSRAFKRDVGVHTDLVEVSDPTTIAAGIHTTGELGTGIVEQALAVETKDGIVVITGCAHPGVDRMVHRAYESFDDRIALVVGGFHLGGATRGRVENIIASFRELGVQKVAPCHCTGDAARSLFDDAFEDDCILAGVGWSTEYALDANH